MKLSSFDYDLPSESLAEWPAENRDESKLMVLHKDTGEIEHLQFKDIVNFFDEGDVLILNNTKVFPARLYGNKEKTGAKIEVFLLRELSTEPRLWDVLVDPARKIRIGNKLYFGEDSSLIAEVIDNTTSRGRVLRFLYDGDDESFKKLVYSLGEPPLPKYIKRDVDESDKERYQTVFAKEVGAVAAPTAGLHFSKNILKKLEIKGVNVTDLTLHIGLGTFNMIQVEDLSKHKMDSEQLVISQECCDIVNKGIAENRKVCAVGTSVMRAIETSVSSYKNLNPFDGWTYKYIFPPYDFSIANCMITNFHMPKSTLIMMVSAFCGRKTLMNAYKEAIDKGYKFYSYGDAMLII